MSKLQENMTGYKSIRENGEYKFRYSPGIIFSGRISAFDIDFINGERTEDRFKIAEGAEEDKTFIGADKGYCTETAYLTYQDGTEWKTIYLTQNVPEDLNNGIIEQVREYATNTTDGARYEREDSDLIREDDLFDVLDKIRNDYGYYDETTRILTEFNDYNLKSEANENKQNSAVCSWLTSEGGDEYNKYVVHFYYYNDLANINTDTAEKTNTVRLFRIYITQTPYIKLPVIVSVANILKNVIATWFKAMQEVALAGLLVVLVYVSIRMLFFSSSEDKAKYKQMLFDWLVAVVIVYSMQYIIALTLAITKAVQNIFSKNIIFDDGIDGVFSMIRGEVNNSEHKIFASIIYYWFIITTVKYTIFYFQRVVYVAFLTMIGPLVGLTYPLDKIKDGQAQAFGIWLKEFFFHALIQPFHLIVYATIIGGVVAEYSLKSGLFAIIVLSFIPETEKFLKKMFGMDKGGNLGNTEAAFNGAAVMSLINSFGRGGSSGGGSGGAPSGGSGKGGPKIRMADNNVYDSYSALRMPSENNPSNTSGNDTGGEAGPSGGGAGPSGGGAGSSGGGAGSSGGGRNNLPFERSNNSEGKGNSSNNSQTNSENKGQSDNDQNGITKSKNRQGKNKKAKSSSSLRNERMFSTRRKKEQPVIKKAATISGKTLRVVGRGVSMATFGAAGFAAGILAKKPLEGLATGTKGGLRIAKNIENDAEKLTQSGIKTARELKGKYRVESREEDTQEENKQTKYRRLLGKNNETKVKTHSQMKYEGSFTRNDEMGTKAQSQANSKSIETRFANRHDSRENGEIEREDEEKKLEAIERVKRGRSFKDTKEYKHLLEDFPDAEKELEKFANAGITDTVKIRIALNNSKNYSTDNAIAFMNLAKKCPSKIAENKEEFGKYLEERGVDKSKIDMIYNAIREFK